MKNGCKIHLIQNTFDELAQTYGCYKRKSNTLQIY